MADSLNGRGNGHYMTQDGVVHVAPQVAETTTASAQKAYTAAHPVAANPYSGATPPAAGTSRTGNVFQPQPYVPDNSSATAQQLRDQLAAEYAAAGSRAAPQASAAQAQAAQQAQAQQAQAAQQASFSAYQAQQAQAAQQAELTRLGQARTVGAPSLGLEQAAPVFVDNATHAGAVNVGYTAAPGIGQTDIPGFMESHYASGPMDMKAAQIGDMQQAMTGGDPLRDRQMALLDYLQGTVEGKNGPSAAEMQFQRNLDKSIAAQHAQAAGAVGTGRVSANLQSGYNIGEMSQDAAAQSAMLRAQEAQQARSDLLAGLTNTRGQDINIGTFNAGQQNQSTLQQAAMQQQAGIQNQNKNMSMAQFNTGLQQQQDLAMADLRGRIGMSNAGLTTQAALASMNVQAARAQQQAQIDSSLGMFNAGADNSQSQLQAQINTQLGTFNAGQANDVAKARAAMQQQAGMFNAGAQNSFSQQQAALNSSERLANMQAENQLNMFNTGQSNAAGMQNSQLGAQVGMFNTGQSNAMDQFNVGQANSVGMFNTGQTNQGNQFNAGLSNQVNISNAGNQLQQQQLDDARRRALMDQMLTSQGQILGNNTANRAIDVQQSTANKQFAGDMISNIAKVGVATAPMWGPLLFSDERVKTDIKPLYSDERGKTDKSALLDHYDGGGKGKNTDDEVGTMLDNLKAYKFKYKDPSADGAAPGQRYGIMAQDLEKSPMGASIVINDGGVKKIDTAQAVGVLLAAMTRMNSKLKTAGRR